MSATAEASRQLAAVHKVGLPLSLRALYVAGVERPASWLGSALGADSASEVDITAATCMADAVARLRDEVFDVVLISHEPPQIDSLELADAIRAGGAEDQAIIMLGAESEQEMAALCYEVGGDAYVCANRCTPRGLLWTLTRAMDYRRLISANRRLNQAELHRRELEHEEAHRLLGQQKRLIESRIEASESNAFRTPDEFPTQLVDHYRELLRTYVIMGAGNIVDEMKQLVRLHLSAGMTAREAMLLHIHVLEEMVKGLGNRSSRHVMNRADVLILETMIHLSDGYRQRLLDHLHPPRQQFFPFMEG